MTHSRKPAEKGRQAAVDQLITEAIWPKVAAIANKASRRYAALAYVTSDAHLKFRRDDVLVCDASDTAVRSGETSADLLRRWFDKGVEIHSLKNLHAKVVVMGRTALIGSCNLSRSSHKTLYEAAVLTHQMKMVSQAKAYVRQLVESGLATEVDEPFLRRIAKIPVTPRRGGGGGIRKALPELGSRCWLVSVKELDEEAFPEEQALVADAEEHIREESGNSELSPEFLRFTDRSRFRKEAKAGDTVIQIWSKRNSDRVSVYPPTALLFRQDERSWTRFYIDESDDLDPLEWPRFSRELKRLGVGGFTKNSVRELPSRIATQVENLWST